MVTLVRPVQPWNAPYSIIVTLLGIIISVSSVQLTKAVPILVTTLPILTAIRVLLVSRLVLVNVVSMLKDVVESE